MCVEQGILCTVTSGCDNIVLQVPLNLQVGCNQSSPTGISSSRYLSKVTRISVVSSPPQYVGDEFGFDLHLNLCRDGHVINGMGRENATILAISNAPRSTPQSTLLNHNPPSRASSGNSTNSANGFSSSVNVNAGVI